MSKLIYICILCALLINHSFSQKTEARQYLRVRHGTHYSYILYFCSVCGDQIQWASDVDGDIAFHLTSARSSEVGEVEIGSGVSNSISILTRKSSSSEDCPSAVLVSTITSVQNVSEQITCRGGENKFIFNMPFDLSLRSTNNNVSLKILQPVNDSDANIQIFICEVLSANYLTWLIDGIPYVNCSGNGVDKCATANSNIQGIGSYVIYSGQLRSIASLLIISNEEYDEVDNITCKFNDLIEVFMVNTLDKTGSTTEMGTTDVTVQTSTSADLTENEGKFTSKTSILEQEDSRNGMVSLMVKENLMLSLLLLTLLS